MSAPTDPLDPGPPLAGTIPVRVRGVCGGGCAAMFVFLSGADMGKWLEGSTGIGRIWIEKSRRDREFRDAESIRDGGDTSGLHTRGYCILKYYEHTTNIPPYALYP